MKNHHENVRKRTQETVDSCKAVDDGSGVFDDSVMPSEGLASIYKNGTALVTTYRSSDTTAPVRLFLIHSSQSPNRHVCRRAQREHDRAMAAAAAAAAMASTTAAADSATATATMAPTTQHPGKRRRTDGASSWRKDTQAGFFLAEEDDGPDGRSNEAHTTASRAKELAPEIDNPFYPAHPKCSDCGVEFWNSQLQVQFGVMVCDACHKKHKDGKCVLC